MLGIVYNIASLVTFVQVLAKVLFSVHSSKEGTLETLPFMFMKLTYLLSTFLMMTVLNWGRFDLIRKFLKTGEVSYAPVFYMSS